MARGESRMMKNASVLIAFPIVGMVGGIALGTALARSAARGRMAMASEFAALETAVKYGFLGMVFCTVLGVYIVTQDWKRLTTTKCLLTLAALTSILVWALVTLLRSLTASGIL